MVIITVGIPFLAVPACSANVPGCLPAPLHVAPGAVRAGDVATVSAPGASCDLSLAKQTEYTVLLVTSDQSWTLGRTHPDVDGHFTLNATIPTDVSPGPARIVVTGSPYDDCEKTGSCVGYTVALTLEGQ
jgi:hypothetical protein